MTDVMIYGEIGFETTTVSVREQLANAEGPISVRINSPGGDVYEGIGILNALREYDGDITVVVESAALSAASFIAVGCGGPCGRSSVQRDHDPQGVEHGGR